MFPSMNPKNCILPFLISCIPFTLWSDTAQISTPRIELFPREGKGYQLIDWHERSKEFVEYTLNPEKQGEYLPLMWWDDTLGGGAKRTFGLPSYIGMKNQWERRGNAHEAITTMGLLISGALLGMDMARYPLPGTTDPVNLVAMQEAYFSKRDGVFLDGVQGRSGGSFWYDLAPSVFAGALVALHPGEEGLAEKWRTSCQTWAEATSNLWNLNNFGFQAYDLAEKRAITRQWTEPDSAAALAFLLQMAHAKWPEEPKFFHMHRRALDWLCAQERNINYEFFPAFGVYAAARCNAEQRTQYDVARVFGWCFEDSAVRGIGPHEKDLSKGDGYGVVSGRWGEMDVAGLVGCSRGALSTPKHRGGYAFAMETFAYSWPLVAAARYDNRLSRAVGKWMHAAVHSARLFYPDQHPPQMQSDWKWASAHTTTIPYEGLMEKNNLTGEPGPFASGDPSNQGWGPLNLGIYSGALSGIFGAIVAPTQVDGVLAIDTRKTDFFGAPAFPSTLVYNPHRKEIAVTLPLGEQPVRLWDAVTNTWISEQPVSPARRTISIRPDSAVLVVALPEKGEARFVHDRLYVGNTVADYSVPDSEAQNPGRP
jgi:hypothetical protein